MPKQKIAIWGREFDLDVVFDCYKGEVVTPTQEDAYNSFCMHLDLLNSCKRNIEEYCKKEHPDIVFDNIFKFVIPQAIFVKRSNDRIVGIMCAYKFDIEHGLVIVFRNEAFEEIGPQDIIL